MEVGELYVNGSSEEELIPEKQQKPQPPMRKPPTVIDCCCHSSLMHCSKGFRLRLQLLILGCHRSTRMGLLAHHRLTVSKI